MGFHITKYLSCHHPVDKKVSNQIPRHSTERNCPQQTSLNVHPRRLTWNIIIEVWKIIFLSKWVICRFHVNPPGCRIFCGFYNCFLLKPKGREFFSFGYMAEDFHQLKQTQLGMRSLSRKDTPWRIRSIVKKTFTLFMSMLQSILCSHMSKGDLRYPQSIPCLF